MGKGDKRTAKGKRIRATYGKSRAKGKRVPKAAAEAKPAAEES